MYKYETPYPTIYLHLIFKILQFEISSLMNWIFFLVKTLREKYSKEQIVRTRKPQEEVYRFFPYRTKTVQYDPRKYKRREDNRQLQNQVKRMDLEEHPLNID